MEMTFEQKRDAAIEFLNKFSQMFDVNFTNEQRAFCIGYLVSMLDAAEHPMQPTGSGRENLPMTGSEQEEIQNESRQDARSGG